MNAEKHYSIVLYYDVASVCNRGARGGEICWGTALQALRSPVWFWTM